MPTLTAGTEVRLTHTDRRPHAFEENEFPFDGNAGIDFVAECRTYGEVIEVNHVQRTVMVRITDFEGALEADLEVSEEILLNGDVVLL